MLDPWSVPVAVGVLLAAAALTVVGGVKLSTLGDVLADRLGVGEAVFGAVAFGAVISASGIVMTVTAGIGGYAELAFSNAIGGVAAQTAALGVADAFYRRANLEHAAASLPNMLFAVIIMMLLTMVLITRQTPEVAIWGVHPGSLVLVVAYFACVHLVRRIRDKPEWTARATSETVPDEPDENAMPDHSTGRLGAAFAAYGVMVAAGGWAVAQACASLVETAGIEASLAGAAIMGVTNALPEMVTSIAAVRRGALTMAVSGILGGNALDVLNVAIGDVAYRGGSIYHAASPDEVTMTLVSILMTGVILTGLMSRQRHGPANVGVEGIVMGAVYIAALMLVGM